LTIPIVSVGSLTGDPSFAAAAVPADAAALAVGAVGRLEPELVLLLVAGVLAVVLVPAAAALAVLLEDGAALLLALLLLLLLPQLAAIRPAPANAHATNLPRLNTPRLNIDSILGPPKFVPIKRSLEFSISLQVTALVKRWFPTRAGERP
jgi:hypothetical protein